MNVQCRFREPAEWSAHDRPSQIADTSRSTAMREPADRVTLIKHPVLGWPSIEQHCHKYLQTLLRVAIVCPTGRGWQGQRPRTAGWTVIVPTLVPLPSWKVGILCAKRFLKPLTPCNTIKRSSWRFFTVCLCLCNNLQLRDQLWCVYVSPLYSLDLDFVFTLNSQKLFFCQQLRVRDRRK